MRERRLPIFRGPQAGDRVQCTRLQRIRFAGRRLVCGQTHRLHVPTATRCGAKQASDRGAEDGQQRAKIAPDVTTTAPIVTTVSCVPTSISEFFLCFITTAARDEHNLYNMRYQKPRKIRNEIYYFFRYNQ